SSRYNFNRNIGHPVSVGQNSPDGNSPYGCCDMAGNVWEWCNDWHDADYYSISPLTNPKGPSSDSAWLIRGGA
ncbi:MAG: SUMF1/EgtB/PvdO family nonheme iron enzyme, partial [bacterium]